MAYQEESKGIYVCSACKKVISKDSVYCSNCGKKLNFVIHDYEIDSQLSLAELIREQHSTG